MARSVVRPSRERLGSGRRSPKIRRRIVGLEHEFVLYDGSRRLDFRPLIHRLGIEGVRADPSDPNAYRGRWGGVITCDGPEAEIAIPPVTARAGFVAEVAGLSRVGRRVLESSLPASVRLDGYSTHLSVSTIDRETDRRARDFPLTFAPGLMLLLDRSTSPGLLVRPRPGRLELCGEYAEGAQLRGAVAYALGSTLAMRALPRRSLADLHVRGRVVPAVERYGWYVDRRAFGPDLYRDARRVRLERERGGTITGQEQLERCWSLARDAAATVAAPEDLASADDVVAGRLPLPSETPLPAVDEPAGSAAADRGIDLSARVRDGLLVEVHTISWPFAVFRVSAPSWSASPVFLSVPGDRLAAFVAGLDRGVYDGLLLDRMRRPPAARLERPEQTRRPGVYGSIVDPGRLLPPEREPETGRRLPPGRAPGAKRAGKREAGPITRPVPEPGRRRRLLIGAAAALVAALIATIVVVALPKGQDRNAAPAGGGPATATTLTAPAGGTVDLVRRSDLPGGFFDTSFAGAPDIGTLTGSTPDDCFTTVPSGYTRAHSHFVSAGNQAGVDVAVYTFPNSAAAQAVIDDLVTRPRADDCIRDAIRDTGGITDLDVGGPSPPAKPPVGDAQYATSRNFGYFAQGVFVGGTVALYIVRSGASLVVMMVVTSAPLDRNLAQSTLKAVVARL